MSETAILVALAVLVRWLVANFHLGLRTEGLIPGAMVADALPAARLPAIEVHLSNIHAGEESRRRTVLTPVCLWLGLVE